MKEDTRYISDRYVSTFFIFLIFWYLEQKEKYDRHYMLNFPLLWAVTSADSYFTTKRNIRYSMLAHPVFDHHKSSLI